MTPPRITVVIPTHNRPAAVLRRAVDSVLHQSLDPGRVELIVVDDGSQPPATPIDHPRVRWHRVDPARGVSRARNLGATLGTGDYLNFLDDDDVLLPDALERLLDAATTSDLPEPVAGIGGRCDVDPDGRVLRTYRPASLPRGRCYQFEPCPPGRSFLCKQTLLIPRGAFEAVGGFDFRFRVREWTDLSVRLNEVCSIAGTDAIVHHRTQHGVGQASKSLPARRSQFRRLLARHRGRLEARPRGLGRLLFKHAERLVELGAAREAWPYWRWAMRVSPGPTLRLTGGRLAYRLMRRRGG